MNINYDLLCKLWRHDNGRGICKKAGNKGHCPNRDSLNSKCNMVTTRPWVYYFPAVFCYKKKYKNILKKYYKKG